MPAIYSARWILPIATPLIEAGAVAIDDSRIVGVGTRAEIVARFAAAPVHDFGEAAILPGLVNAHSHLELTVMRGFLEAEENDFFAWLRKLTVARMAMTNEDLLVSATCGAIEAARAGITCLADSSSFASESMLALQQVGLRGIVYQESFGPDPALAEENVAKLRQQVDQMRARESNLVRAGVSPHAPYTVSSSQLRAIARWAVDQNLPLMMHAAESEAEKLFVTEGTGAFAEGLQKRGIKWQAPRVSTIQYLKQVGILEGKPLLAHCINVDAKDLETIGESGAGIAHCPKSNAKLGHGRAPFAQFLKHGIHVGLGSDSVASNNTCDILEESRFATLLARLPEARPLVKAGSDHTISSNQNIGSLAADTISAGDALFAATLGGAQALGLDDEIGALKTGMQADLTIVDLSGAHQQPATHPVEALMFSSSGRDVVLTMVAGREVFREGKLLTASEGDLRTRSRAARKKLDALAEDG